MDSYAAVMPTVIDIIAKRREERLRRSALHERLLSEFVGTFLLAFAIGISATSVAATVASSATDSDDSSNATTTATTTTTVSTTMTMTMNMTGNMSNSSFGGSFSGSGGGIDNNNHMAPVAVGLVLAVQVCAFGPVSGAFLNPAVTLAVLAAGRGKISLPHAVLYVVAQLLGAIAAGFCAFAATGGTFCFDYALTRGWGTSFEFEVLFTAVLCLTVLAVSTSNDAPNQYFGFAIGMTVAGCALASGALHQCSLNPAVALGMNLVNYVNADATHNPSESAWALFLLAPLLGGVLAAMVFCSTRGSEYDGPAEATASASGATLSTWSVVTVATQVFGRSARGM